MKPGLPYFRIFLCAALLCAAQLTMAETPAPPVEVPAGCAVPSRESGMLSEQDLNQQRSTVMKHYQDWKSDASKWNKRCANRNMDSDSLEAKGCTDDLAILTKQGTRYNTEAAAFKGLIGRCFE